MRMRRLRIAGLVALGLLVLTPVALASTRTGRVRHVDDGDTIILVGGERVRLVQIDSPEIENGAECWGAQAAAETHRLLPVGTTVRVVTDPKLDQHDRYGRSLAYVWKGGTLINLRLVRDGMAAPYFFDDDIGRYARTIFRAAVAARKAGRGLWGHCRRGAVQLRPTAGVSTGPVSASPVAQHLVSSPGRGCNPNYTPCIPNSARDLNCTDIRKEVHVIGRDVYDLDSDGDGYGCESYGAG
jgi:endonuclease YncB( thermonuclease family)